MEYFARMVPRVILLNTPKAMNHEYKRVYRDTHIVSRLWPTLLRVMAILRFDAGNICVGTGILRRLILEIY